MPGVPPLPESLRVTWANEPLPAWVIDETGLPEGSTMAALGSGVWAYGLRMLSRRLRYFLAHLVDSRRSEILSLPVFARPWPASLSPTQWPWPNRTRHCLEKAGLLEDHLALSRITYTDLFKIQAMGALSILDFASAAEGAINQLSEEATETPFNLDFETPTPKILQHDALRRATRDRLLAVMEQNWASQVSEQDPRFTDLLPPGAGTIFERIDELMSMHAEDSREEQRLAQAIPAIASRIQEIDRLSLDVALKEFLVALWESSGRKQETLLAKKQDALLARLGWDGSGPITLEEAGYIAGITRERLRQLQNHIEERLPSHPVFMPALDKAITTLTAQAPIEAEQAAHLLVTEGISSKPFSPQSILMAANACKREIPFHIEEHRGRSLVIARSHGRYLNNLLIIASRQAMASGATNIAEVTAEALSSGIPVAEATVREILHAFPDLQFLEDDWFWYPKGKNGGNPIQNNVRKMLSVVSPMSVTMIREGLRREYRYRSFNKPGKWDLIVPPRPVLRAFFRTHPEFEIDELDQVTPTAPLDCRVELPPMEQVLVDVFRSAPICVLDRASCAKKCIEQGMNQYTFAVYLTYCCVITHLGTEIWTLRGVQVDPAVVNAVRAANAERPRRKRVLDYGWSQEGRLWAAVRLPNIKSQPSFVFQLPAPIRGLLADREFSALSESGIPAGRIRITEDGRSWGYGPFLSRSGADESDILIVEFDLADHTALLRLGDDEVLEKLNP
jgi:hypothetical protein